MATITPLGLEGVFLITPKKHGDDRGYFTETYNARVLAEAGITAEFVQDNQSLSAPAGTVRGLHFQAPPFAQAKLVRVIEGAVVDVAVDARKGSPTYGQHVKATLTGEGGEQLFVPRGFLHGFATLKPNTIVAYKVDNFYDKASDGGVLWNDPDLAIDWEVAPGAAVLSPKDETAQRFSEFDTPF